MTIGAPTDPVVTRLMRAPRVLQRLATRLPERLQPQPPDGVHVRAYDEAGGLVHDVVIDTRDFHMVTGVREHHGRVWVGSLREAAIAWFDL